MQNITTHSDEISSYKEEIEALKNDLKQTKQDIKKARILYQQESELLLSIINASDDLFFAKDTNFKIITCNEAFGKLVGLPTEQIIGRSDDDWYSDEDKVEFFRRWDRKIFRDKKTQKIREWVDYPDGSRVLLDTVKYPLILNGAIAGLVGVSRIATKEWVAEQELKKASRSKSHLLANMSHELRTPLNAIIGFSSSIKEEIFGPLENEKYREYVRDISSSGQHLLELINDILDVSAIEADALELSNGNVSLSKVVEYTVRLIQSRANEGMVSISCYLDPDTPMIHADERRVKQILLNLLSNAVKFTPEGGDVSVAACLNDDGSLSIAVNDSGVGMDQYELEKALSKFGQVDSGLDRKHEGTGLGLPLTIGLMEAHGGTLEVKSEKGRGTQIKVTFPKERVGQNVC